MKKRYILFVALAAVLPAAAQETYEVAEVATQDLNGTARYVGMGGAMEALGADISTISTNPAAIGLFRRSQVSASLSVVSQGGESSYASANKTNLSFDQIGFVYSNRLGRSSFVNLAFNYHKSRNFNQILRVADRLDGASQSRLTMEKFANGLIKSANDLTYSQVDVLYHEGLYDTNLLDEKGNFNEEAYWFDGDNYTFNRGNHGYVSEYDFNLSGNLNDRVYLGLSVGFYDVKYRGYSLYDETVLSNPLSLFTTTLEDSRTIDGTGVDVKVGAVFRPIEASPFRFGLYISSPTFYSLRSKNTTGLQLNDEYYGDENPRFGDFEYEFRTPWKFGVSLGHTVGTDIALGLTYEYSDYSATDARIKGDDYYDYYADYYYSTSDTDNAMNGHIKETLKGVHLLKAGVEYKPVPELAVRLGYNYVSPMYKQDAYRGVDVHSLGNYYSSETDYVNWKDTHRITAGLGYSIDKFRVDLAYQYSTRKGQFLPFTGSNNNLPFDKEVSNNRHQVLLTLGYNF